MLQSLKCNRFVNAFIFHVTNGHIALQGQGFRPPPFTSLKQTKLPAPRYAINGDRVTQPLITLAYTVEALDVSFHLQLRPNILHRESSTELQMCPQYLVVGRYAIITIIFSVPI